MPSAFGGFDWEDSAFERAYAEQANSYLVKPFTPTSFREKIEGMTKVSLRPAPQPGN